MREINDPNNEDNPQPSEPTKIKPNNYRIPIEAIIDLKERNLSNHQIATLLKCNPTNIYQRLKGLENTKKYVKNRALVFSHLQCRIIEHITEAKLQKAPLDRLIWSLAVLYDKERLEMDKSTCNIAYADLVGARAQLQTERQQLCNITE